MQALKPTDTTDPPRLQDPRSIALIVLAWVVLQGSGLFSPGLLDDVDSIYLEVAREMLHRADFVTPYVDGVRFFDKPPLMYWLAAGPMRLFGEQDWAGRLPLALAVLALLLATYALGRRLLRSVSPAAQPDRGGLYAALALGTALGPYLYTRFYIPDMLLALWLTLAVHLFLIAIDRAEPGRSETRSPLLPSLALAVVLALDLLTKGFVGLVFPLGVMAVYLGLSHKLALLRRLPLLRGTAAFLLVALPWHVLAALRNPPIAMPAGLGLPARAGWAWFYLGNEHIARFFGKRIPHDYGQTPVWLFWAYALLWTMPWGCFLPAALGRVRRVLAGGADDRDAGSREAAHVLTLWVLLVLGFFTLSSRQEYYSLPAMPAFALVVGGVLARAETAESRAVRACHRWLLLPLASGAAVVSAMLAAATPTPAPAADLASALAHNPALYNLSLGHLFDLTGAAMGFFKGPLIAVAAGFVLIGPVSFIVRRRARPYAANLLIAAGATVALLAAHAGLARFYPVLGSEGLADAILAEQETHPAARDLLVLDGELTSGSSLLFYTRQSLHLLNGRVNGPWFGSFYPDAPAIFESEESIRRLWAGPERVFLLTPAPATRALDLRPFGGVRVLRSEGGKTVLTNR